MEYEKLTYFGYPNESSSDDNYMSEKEDDSDDSEEGLNDVSKSDDGNSRSSDD